MKKLGLFALCIMALYGACTKEDMSSPGSAEPGYSSGRLAQDTILFDGVWKLTLFDNNHHDVTDGFREMAFLFKPDSTLQVLSGRDTLSGIWWYDKGMMKTDFHIQFPAGGGILSALNGDYQTRVVSDHQFILVWPSEERSGLFRSIEFRRLMSI
jgi:hypothetical protein